MTYRELDEASNRLAHVLVGCGRGAGTAGGVVVAAFGRRDRGDAGGAEDRCGLRADRPGGAGGADAVRARRRRTDRRDHHRGSGGRLDGQRSAGHRYR